jgi:ribosome maturation protein SDO1
VLQIPQVFLHVSKGQVASNEDLKVAFGTTDQNEIILEILKKGELQVGGKERQAQQSQVLADVVQQVAGKCVNPASKRPYPPSIIDKALKEVGFNLSATKSAKLQSLEAIKLLVAKQVIPIARARMKIRISAPSRDAKKFSDKVKALIGEVDDEDFSDIWELVGFIDPGVFREIEELVAKESKGKGHVEVQDTAVVKVGDEEF